MVPALAVSPPGAELRVTIFDHGSRLEGHLCFHNVDPQAAGAVAFLRAGLLFEVDEQLRMELSLPTAPDEVLQAIGRVAWIRREADGDSPGMGIELTWVPDDDLLRLKSYLRSIWRTPPPGG